MLTWRAYSNWLQPTCEQCHLSEEWYWQRRHSIGQQENFTIFKKKTAQAIKSSSKENKHEQTQRQVCLPLFDKTLWSWSQAKTSQAHTPFAVAKSRFRTGFDRIRRFQQKTKNLAIQEMIKSFGTLANLAGVGVGAFIFDKEGRVPWPIHWVVWDQSPLTASKLQMYIKPWSTHRAFSKRSDESPPH